MKIPLLMTHWLFGNSYSLYCRCGNPNNPLIVKWALWKENRRGERFYTEREKFTHLLSLLS